MNRHNRLGVAFESALLEPYEKEIEYIHVGHINVRISTAEFTYAENKRIKQCS
jgi:hypothetical protein